MTNLTADIEIQGSNEGCILTNIDQNTYLYENITDAFNKISDTIFNMIRDGKLSGNTNLNITIEN